MHSVLTLHFSYSRARLARAEEAGDRAAPVGALPPRGESHERRSIRCRGSDLTASRNGGTEIESSLVINV